MDGISICDLGSTEDCRDIQVTLRGAGGADADGFISESYMKRLSINIRIDTDGLYPEFFASSDDADRYLTAVCYKDFFE